MAMEERLMVASGLKMGECANIKGYCEGTVLYLDCGGDYSNLKLHKITHTYTQIYRLNKW